MIGNHMLKSWSSTQRNVTLSSEKSDLVVAVKLCGECIGLTQLATNWGIPLVGHVHVDSPAIGIANRKGNGKTPPCEGRHAVDTEEETMSRKVKEENH